MSVVPVDAPFEHFARWFAEAKAKEPSLPEAMSVATATPDGVPSTRLVLLKDYDRRGFVFYTNVESRKGDEIAANPRAALCFHWKSLLRQIRIEGRAEFADRRLGLGAVAALWRARRTREARSRGGSAFCRRAGAAPPLLDRLPRHAALFRVLGGSSVSSP